MTGFGRRSSSHSMEWSDFDKNVINDTSVWDDDSVPNLHRFEETPRKPHLRRSASNVEKGSNHHDRKNTSGGEHRKSHRKSGGSMRERTDHSRTAERHTSHRSVSQAKSSKDRKHDDHTRGSDSHRSKGQRLESESRHRGRKHSSFEQFNPSSPEKKGHSSSRGHKKDKELDVSRSSSVASKRREKSMRQGSSLLLSSSSHSKSPTKSSKSEELKAKSPSKSKLKRSSTAETPSRRRIAPSEVTHSRSRATQRSEKRTAWRESCSTRSKSCDFDDVLDQRAKVSKEEDRRKKLLDVSKHGPTRYSSRRRGCDTEDDDDDLSSIYSMGTEKNAYNNEIEAPFPCSRRSSCSYLPSGLSSPAPPSTPLSNRGRRASVFGSMTDRSNAIYKPTLHDDGNGDYDDDSGSAYLPSVLATPTTSGNQFDLDRADRSSSTTRRASLASSLCIPNVHGSSSDLSAKNGPRGEGLKSTGSSDRSLQSTSSRRNLNRKSSTRADKTVEEVLKNRRLRGDSVSRIRPKPEDDAPQKKHDPLSMISNVTTNVTNGVAKGVTNVTNGLTIGVSHVAGGVSNVAGGVTKGVSNVAGGVQKGVSNVAGGVTKGVTNVAGGVTKGVTNVAGGVTKGVTNVAGGVTKGVTNVAGGVTKGVTKGVTNVAGGVSKGVTNVAGGVKHLAGNAVNISRRDSLQ